MGAPSVQSGRRSVGDEQVSQSLAWHASDDDVVDDPDAAFGSFFEEFAPRLRALASRFRRTDDLVEDLVQEVLLRAYRAEVHLEVGTSPWPWLSTVCRNLAIDAGRRREFRGEQAVDVEVFTRIPAPAESFDDPEQVTLMAGGDIAEALSCLDERQRRLLVLKHVRGWSYEELAEWEGISFPALRSALCRARQKFTETYWEMSERRAMPAAVTLVTAAIGRRLRTLRDRITGAESALTQQAAAFGPGLGSAVASLVALGALAVTGSLDAASADRAARPLDRAGSTDTPVSVSEPAWDSVLRIVESSASESIATDVEVGEPVAVHQPEPRPAPPSGGDAGVSLVPETEVTVEDRSATANSEGQEVTVDGSVKKADQDGGTGYRHDKVTAKSDTDGDGEFDTTVETPGGAWCPPEEERTAVGTLACPVLDAAADGPDDGTRGEDGVSEPL